MKLYIEIQFNEGHIYCYDDIGAFEVYNDTTWLYQIGKHMEDAIRIDTKTISQIQIERVED